MSELDRIADRLESLFRDLRREESRLDKWAGEMDAHRERVEAERDEAVDALRAIVERSDGRLHSTDQETGETFYALAQDAIAKAEGVGK